MSDVTRVSVELGGTEISFETGKLAKQARQDGNADGARRAETLSRWLIGIMLTGVVTVGIAVPLDDPAVLSRGCYPSPSAFRARLALPPRRGAQDELNPSHITCPLSSPTPQMSIPESPAGTPVDSGTS